MARKVIWNKRATHNFNEIVNYLEEHASEVAIIKFVKNADDLIEKLLKYPDIGKKAIKTKTIRYYKIDKNRRMYYRKHGRKLIIVFIFDERRNPELNPYK